MRISTTGTLSRVLAGAGVTAAVITPLAAGTAAASPAHETGNASAPSSCRPANYRGTVTADPASAGTLHYRVTLTAAPGYADCTLQGSPQDVLFSQGAGQAGVSATPTGDQRTPVTFGPGHPVHFAITSPNTGGAPVDGASFTLSAPGGVIPGSGAATAQVAMRVDKGTRIGPVQPGA